MMNVKKKGKCFVDDIGRQRIFNGLNMVYKGRYQKGTKERHYIPDWNETHFIWLKEKGFNCIRLGVVWDAIEHEPGQYNDDYIQWVNTMLDYCDQYEIYAFLDMHQDLYGEPFGGGAPSWAAVTEGEPHMTGELWSDAYLYSSAINKCFSNFWDNAKVNGKGLQDYYLDMWLYLLKHIKGHPSLIGYDFINEPFPGQHTQEIFAGLIYSYKQLAEEEKDLTEIMESFSNEDVKFNMLKKVDDVELYKKMTVVSQEFLRDFDEVKLVNFYKKMINGVRESGHRGIIMLENSYFSNMGILCNLPRFNDNLQDEWQVAFSCHGYDLMVDTPYVQWASNNRIQAIFDNHKEVQKRLDSPVMVGEWGAHALYEEGLSHIRYILDLFDRNQWSHTYWCYHDGIETAPVIRALSRSYPQAICGDIIEYGNHENNDFYLDWIETDNTSLEESIIFLNRMPKEIYGVEKYELNKVLQDGHSYLIKIPCIGSGLRQLKVLF